MVDGSCGLEPLVVVLVLHIGLFGIFQRASCEAGGGFTDAIFGWGEMEINRHDD